MNSLLFMTSIAPLSTLGPGSCTLLLSWKLKQRNLNATQLFKVCPGAFLLSLLSSPCAHYEHNQSLLYNKTYNRSTVRSVCGADDDARWCHQQIMHHRRCHQPATRGLSAHAHVGHHPRPCSCRRHMHLSDSHATKQCTHNHKAYTPTAAKVSYHIRNTPSYTMSRGPSQRSVIAPSGTLRPPAPPSMLPPSAPPARRSLRAWSG
jgi:hypothetical protein